MRRGPKKSARQQKARDIGHRTERSLPKQPSSVLEQLLGRKDVPDFRHWPSACSTKAASAALPGTPKSRRCMVQSTGSSLKTGGPPSDLGTKAPPALPWKGGGGERGGGGGEKKKGKGKRKRENKWMHSSRCVSDLVLRETSARPYPLWRGRVLHRNGARRPQLHACCYGTCAVQCSTTLSPPYCNRRSGNLAAWLVRCPACCSVLPCWQAGGRGYEFRFGFCKTYKASTSLPLMNDMSTPPINASPFGSSAAASGGAVDALVPGTIDQSGWSSASTTALANLSIAYTPCTATLGAGVWAKAE